MDGCSSHTPFNLTYQDFPNIIPMRKATDPCLAAHVSIRRRRSEFLMGIEMVVTGIDTWRDEGEGHGDASVDVRRSGGRFGVGGCRRGRGGGGAAEDGVVEVEGRERLRELPYRGGVSFGNTVEAESQVDASAQLVEVLVGYAPQAAPAAAVDRLAAQPRVLAVGVRRPRTHLEEPHGGKIGVGSAASSSFSFPREGEGRRCALAAAMVAFTDEKRSGDLRFILSTWPTTFSLFTFGGQFTVRFKRKKKNTTSWNLVPFTCFVGTEFLPASQLVGQVICHAGPASLTMGHEVWRR